MISIPPESIDEKFLKAVDLCLTKEEKADLLELDKFVCLFKRYRIGLEITQNEVGAELGKIYANEYSQSTISRFESLHLSYRIMIRIRKQLVEWIKHNQEMKPDNLINPELARLIDNISHDEATTITTATMTDVCKMYYPRRKRTVLDHAQKDILDAYYSACAKPSIGKLQEIADVLGLERDVVRVWFSNKRQKIRKNNNNTEEPLSNALFSSLKARTNSKSTVTNSSPAPNNTS